MELGRMMDEAFFYKHGAPPELACLGRIPQSRTVSGMSKPGYSGFMKRFIAYSLVVAGIFVSRGFVYAEHDKSCKNVHGKVTVIAEDGITVGDKMYKVGRSTRISKEDKVVKLEDISVGDMVCLDPRGQDDIGVGGGASAAVRGVHAPRPTNR